MPEHCRHWGFKLHRLPCDGMIETQQPGMQTKPVQRIVAIAIFCIATNGVAHIGSMDTNLVLPSCLQFKLYQRVFRRAIHHIEMSNSQFTAIVVGRRIGHVGLIILQPVLNRTLILFPRIFAVP